MSKSLLNVSWALFFILCVFSKGPLEAVWSSPIAISTTNSNNPEIGTDAFGNATAVWQEFDGVNTNIQSATLSKGANWSAPLILSSAFGHNTHADPQIAVDPSGDGVAIWVEQNDVASTIRAAILSSESGWSLPVDVSVPGTAQSPQIAVDYAGNAVAVWVRLNDAGRKIIQTATLPAGGDWSYPVDLSIATEDAFSPHVEVDSFGNAIAIWTLLTAPNFVIQSATLPFGGSWSDYSTISDASESASEPKAAVDLFGNAVVVWQRFNGFDFAIKAATLPFGGSWTTPVDISAAGAGSLQPNIIVDFLGNALAIWSQSVDDDFIIQSASLPFGGSWSAPVNISPIGAVSFDPNIVLDSAGNATAIWDRNNGIDTVIQTATLPFGGIWSLPVDLSAAGQVSNFPRLAMDSSGYAVVDWTNETFAVIQSTAWTPAPTVTNVDPNTGFTTGGNSVTITGTNFINVSSVNFGATSASSFTVISPTSIIAIAPTEAVGIVDVTVVTFAGISTIATNDQYAYQIPPAPPVVSKITPHHGPVEGGRLVRIHGKNFNNVTGVTFGSASASSFVVVSPTLILAVTPPGFGTVDVVVTTTAGASSVTVHDRYTYHTQLED